TGRQIGELRESQKETDRGIDRLRESQKETGRQIGELRESQKETDRQLLESYAKNDEQMAITRILMEQLSKRVDDVTRQLGELGLVQGEVAEDLFYRNVKHLFLPKGKSFATVIRNLKKKGTAEYDIVASDGEDVLVIEVKNKLSARMVDSFIRKKLPNFRTVFPEYRNFRLSGGIGALVVKDEVGRYAEKAGLYVLTQTADGGAALLNRKNFKPKIF
ncbi:MAG: hypothetical protein V2I97_12180, partial [Desulfococcaceae bacterium]|nr:hypothetical protein [Desulfococcaceae bacterium]